MRGKPPVPCRLDDVPQYRTDVRARGPLDLADEDVDVAAELEMDDEDPAPLDFEDG